MASDGLKKDLEAMKIVQEKSPLIVFVNCRECLLLLFVLSLSLIVIFA